MSCFEFVESHGSLRGDILVDTSAEFNELNSIITDATNIAKDTGKQTDDGQGATHFVEEVKEGVRGLEVSSRRGNAMAMADMSVAVAMAMASRRKQD